MTSDDDIKLKVLGRMQLDSSPANLRTISTELKLPYSKLIKWRKELKEATDAGDISSLVDADQLLIHRVAEDVKNDLKDLAPTEGEFIEAAVDDVVDGIDSYKVLNTRLQTTALVLAQKIDNMADIAVTAKDVIVLVDALAKLQLAFFNKSVTNVNVLNQQNSYTADSVSTFKGLKRR